MNLKLSVVVPIYQVEQYLPRCVDSLLNQDLSSDEYEIILVDDGSPDRCGEICDEYASCYANIKVVHRENGGLSAARNSGIDVAQGKYIQFVDSDDYLEPNVLKTMVEKMEDDDLDVLRFNYQNVNEKGEVIHPNKDSKRFVDYSGNVCDGLTFLNERLGPACYAWQFIIRRELVNGCTFKEGIYFEDTEWTPRLLLKGNRVSSTELFVYSYLIRTGSITKSIEKEKKKKVVQDMLSVIGFLQQQKTNLKDKRWFDVMTTYMALSIVSYVTTHCYEMKREVVCNLKEKNIFPLCCYQVTINNYLKTKLLNISPNLLFYYLHMKRGIKSCLSLKK